MLLYIIQFIYSFDSKSFYSADETNPHKERKYIVYERSLLRLFKFCSLCHCPCKTSMRTDGTKLTVTTECASEHIRNWTNEPEVAGRSAGNIVLSSAVLFSGANPTVTLRMLRLINLQVMCDRTFYRYQEGYLLPAIADVSFKITVLQLILFSLKEHYADSRYNFF